MFVLKIFVEINKIITVLILNNIVICFVLVLMCILVTFCISNPIAVKLHDIMTFSYFLLIRDNCSKTRVTTANILLVVKKLQNCKSYLLLPPTPTWILAVAVKLAGAKPIVAPIYKIISNHCSSKIKTKIFHSQNLGSTKRK